MVNFSHRLSHIVPVLFGKLARIHLLGLFLFTGVLLNIAQGAEPNAASDDAAMVRPLVVQRTIVVAKFDPAKIDLPADNGVAQQNGHQREELTQLLRSLRSATGDQPIYTTAGIPMSKEDRPFFFVLNDASQVDQPLLLDHLRIAGPEISARQRDGKLILAPVKEERIDAVLDELQPVPREELSAAFEAVSSYPIQLLVLPPDYLRRTIAELVPRLPEELGGGPSDVLTEGIIWAAFGLDPVGHRGEVVFQSASESAAQRLVDYLPKTLTSQTLFRDALTAILDTDPSSAPQEFESWLAAARPLVELKRDGDRVVLRLKQGEAGAAIWPLLARSAAKTQEKIRQSDHSNKFKQILLAMHNYHDTYGAFPPADRSRDEEGKAQLSWRVHLLPFLEEAELFEQFRLDEPWDSPHNLPLLDKMPEIFASRSAEKPGQTTFLAPVGEDTVLGGDEVTRFLNITDGTSNTVVLVEVEPALAVPWTAPEDYRFDPETPAKGLQVDNDGRFLAGIADGSMQRMQSDVAAEILVRIFRKSDGNPVDWNALR